MKFYKDAATNKWILGTIEGYPAGKCLLDKDPNSNKISIIRESDGKILHTGDVKDFIYLNSSDALVNYDTYANFATATSDFFVKPAGGIESGQEVIDALGFTPEDSSKKGVANGYTPLGADIKVASQYLPSALAVGAIENDKSSSTDKATSSSYANNTNKKILLGGAIGYINEESILTTGNITSSFTIGGNVNEALYVNKNMVVAQDSIIKRIYGKFQAGTVSVYIVNSTKTALRIAGTFTATNGINDVSVNIPIYAGESISTDKFYYRNTTSLVDKYFFTGTTITSQTISTFELAYQIFYEYNQSATIEKGVVEIEDILDDQQNVIDSIRNGGDYQKINYETILTTGNITSAFTTGGNVTTDLYVNKNMTVSHDSTIKRIYGKFQAGTVSVYIINSAKTILRIAGTFVVVDGLNDITVNIPIYAGEVVTTDNFYYRSASTQFADKYTFSGTSISAVTGASLEVAYQIEYEFISTVQLEKGVDELFIDINNSISDIISRDKGNYIKLHNTLSEYTLSGFAYIGGKLISSNANDYCWLNKVYHSDNRYIRIDATITPNSIIKIPCAWGGISSGEGASCFAIDLQNKKVIIYSVGDGTDTQGNSFGYTNTELAYTTITADGYLGNDYIVELHKDGLVHKLVLTNKLSGVSTSVTHAGWGAGRQNQYYYIQNIQGSITINSSEIFSLYNPDIVFVGDSMTEGVGVSDRTLRYAELFRTNNVKLNVVISARGGDNIDGVLTKFDTEYNIYKPKKMSVLIGANGGNTLEKLQLLKAKCDSIGCVLYLNRLPCFTDGDNHIAINALIDSTLIQGARFDIATAKDYFPLVDGTHLSPRLKTSLYNSDHGHPNVLGNGKMYERFNIDIQTLSI